MRLISGWYRPKAIRSSANGCCKTKKSLLPALQFTKRYAVKPVIWELNKIDAGMPTVHLNVADMIDLPNVEVTAGVVSASPFVILIVDTYDGPPVRVIDVKQLVSFQRGIARLHTKHSFS